jgi:hypothetical protein
LRDPNDLKRGMLFDETWSAGGFSVEEGVGYYKKTVLKI